jgi:penicillin-binding protein 1A
MDWLRKPWLGKLKWMALFAGLGATALALTGMGFFAMAIQQNPGNAFTRDGIMQILSKESTVYYSDGKTKVGTFFEGQHRDYVPFDSIPRTIVDALVAAEDHNYWKHGGVDFKGLAYALLDDLKSMSFKRGGSTLTQQTAKNLFNRKGHTFGGKIKELVNAYRLEKHFTKEEILEFYLNQFYVSGNGHGVRIAARYFFNKDLANLNLLECAFIAGSVKGPNQYNPFMQETSEKKELALRRAQFRVAYVLKQLYRDGKIDQRQYAEASHQKLEFHRGAFRFALSTNMVKVKRILESPPMQAVLDKHDVVDFMTEGLQVYTTLDANMQQAAEYATYSNLSRLDLILRGYQAPEDSAVSLVSHFSPGGVYTGRIVKAPVLGKNPIEMELSFGSARATLPAVSLDKFFRTWNMHETGTDELPSPAVRAEAIKKHFQAGQLLLVGVPYEYRADGKLPDGPLQLEVLQHPQIQGGAEILRDGRVLANVGGFGNTGYDRVNQARRQFGSGFKPLVYTAALELGWKPLDPLPNFRQLFRLGNIFYFPKPDHAPEDTVSMAWAGRRSENTASIYLLFHLFDKTQFARFWEIGREVGFAPEKFNMQGEFEIFVRDSLGLVLDRDRARELLYQKEAADLAIDLTFEGRVAEAEAVKSLPYGLGFGKERQKYDGSNDKEDRLRYRILGRNFLAYLSEAKAWENRANNGMHFTLARRGDPAGAGPVGIFLDHPDSGWTPLADQESFLGDDSALIQGEITTAVLKRVDAKLSARDGEEPPGYTKENLYASQDFRALAALRYIVWFSRKLGLTSPLDPVISYPLGVNVITLGEAVNAYQALKDGYVYHSKFNENQLFIEKICLHDGTVIFEDYLEREKVLSDKARFGIESILGTVVKGGTGQQIGRELKIPTADKNGPQITLPAYGKTGTTNDYRNAAFLGFVAAPKGVNKGFDSQSGFAIGSYVGFDDNTPMQRKGFKGTGASGAIPAWISIARAVAAVDGFADRVDLLDLDVQTTGQPPLFQQEKYQKVSVSKRNGLPVPPDAKIPDGYAEDISDELGGGGADPPHPNALSTILLRDE